MTDFVILHTSEHPNSDLHKFDNMLAHYINYTYKMKENNELEQVAIISLRGNSIANKLGDPLEFWIEYDYLEFYKSMEHAGMWREQYHEMYERAKKQWENKS